MAGNLPFHLWESLLFDVLRTLPHMVLALYSFRDHWRFSKRTTILMTSVVWIIEMTIPQIYRFVINTYTPLFNIIEVTIYIVFIFVELKEHTGKLVFTVLSLSNLGNIMTVGGKCLEGLFFPEFARLRYHYTYSLFCMPVVAAELFIAYRVIFRDICTHGEDDSERIGGYMWRYLWLVPAIFSILDYHKDLTPGKPLIEYRMDPMTFLYQIFVTAGSMLIYRIIVKMAALHENNMALLAENHALSIQRLQYDSLNERLENMRRTRHDIRHHAALLKEIRDSGDITALDGLISMYTKQNRLDQPLIFCENETVNIVLALYSETANNNGIDFTVKADIPKDIFVSKNDLVVMFGNLLENAADACSDVADGRFIHLTAAYNDTPGGSHCLSLVVKNSFGTVSRDNEGVFHSTKHPGDGIGISSVKNITEKYSGALSFTPEEGVFSVSVILYSQSGS